MRLIDADEIKNRLLMMCTPEYDKKRQFDVLTTLAIAEFIENPDFVPTIDPVMHGYWINDGHYIICSHCGMIVHNSDYEGEGFPTNYCMNCGAKMDEEA